MTALIFIPLGLLLFVLMLFIGMYNGLVSVRNHCEEAWSNIDTELQRRYDLIPNLVNTVKGYAKHERELLEELVQLREQASQNRGDVASQAVDENKLQQALSKLMVRLEAYPDLKASGNFVELQKELANTENRIQAALRFYNGNVRENNNRIEQFPSNLVAAWFHFGKREFFELENPAAHELPKVEF